MVGSQENKSVPIFMSEQPGDGQVRLRLQENKSVPIFTVGMVNDIRVMVAAVIGSVVLMMVAAGPIGRFISSHPTVKMLALAFLFVIGVMLIADGLDHHVPRGYVYFAMAFSVCVEMLNLRIRRRAALPVELRERYTRLPNG
jgi:predicted tellurium resistance membrane protein TerC